jgi:Flp pilus assembly protein TadD
VRPGPLILIPCCWIVQCLLLHATSQSTRKPSTSTAPSEERVFARIERLVGSKDYANAESLLQSAISEGTPPAGAYLRMGKILLDRDDWERASRYLKKSLQFREENDQAHLFLGFAYRKLGQPEQAETEFIQAAELNPRSDVNAYFAGHQLLIDVKFEAALPYLYKAVKLNPRNASAYRALGAAQVHLGNYGLAESYYRKALEAVADPGSAEPGPYLDLAFILLLGHDPAKVQEGLKLALSGEKLQPNSSEAHYLVGKALMKMGRAKEAVRELETAARLNPADSKAHFQLALAYDQLGQKEKARAERQALAITKQRGNQQGTASGTVMPRTVQ